MCPLGSVNFQGVCQSTAGTLGQCDASFNCPGGAYCDKTRNRCACPPDTVLVGSLCITPTRFGLASAQSTCSYDADCDEGRVCVLNKYVSSLPQLCISRCRCMFGEHPDGTCQNLWALRMTTVSRNHPEVACPREISHKNNFRDKESRPRLRLPNQSVNINSMMLACLPLFRFVLFLSQRSFSVEIGATCVRVGVACGGGSICVAGICVCPLGMTPYQNTCVELKNGKLLY